jgi:hypothetical protein
VISTADGTFSGDGLPPGDYFVAAVDTVPGGRGGDDWQDPDYLETLMPRAQHLMLSEGTRVTLSLSVLAP